MTSHMTAHVFKKNVGPNEIILLLENNKMLQNKNAEKTAHLFSIVRGAKRRPLVCQAAILTVRLSASPGTATFKTACNRGGGDTIAELVTGGRHMQS